MSAYDHPQQQYRKHDPDEPFLGSAVKNGVLRFTSAKQIMMFDSKTDGGCPRKWAFTYVFGKKLAKTTALIKGADFAEKLEHYLKTGEDVLPKELQPAKKFFPEPSIKPGVFDLEVEQAFAPGPKGLGKEIELAIKARERLLQLRQSEYRDYPSSKMEIENLLTLIQKHSGLALVDVPIDGAADFRHTRGVFIDEEGHLRNEPPGMIVVETGDLKTPKRIYPHRILKGELAGTILPGFAKSAAEVCSDVQMVLYGRYAHNKYPQATHHRLSHIYANKEKREAAKRTGLISVEQVFERTHRIEGVVREMESTAGALRPEDVEPCLSACDSYTHVDPEDPEGKRVLPGCGHRYYCPLSTTQVSMNVFGYKEGLMGLSLFDSLEEAQTPMQPPQVPPPAQFSPEEYARQVEAERQRLTENVKPMGVCVDCGVALSPANTSVLSDRITVKHIGCPGAQLVTSTASLPPVPASSTVTIPAPVPAIEGAIGVRPPDAPTVDWVDSAKPLPEEEIARVEDPALRQKLMLHREEWLKREAQKVAAQVAQSPSTDAKWCQPQCPKVVITADILQAKKWICHCGKSYTVTTLKPIQEGDKLVSVIPKHKPINKLSEASKPPLPSSAPTPPPLPNASQPVTALPPPQIPTPPTPPLLQSEPVGEMTAMVNKMFGPPSEMNGNGVHAVEIHPVIESHVNDETTRKIAQAIINALLPFTK